MTHETIEPNSIRLNFSKNASNITRKDIINALVSQLQISTKFMSYISTPFTYKSWVVTFKIGFSIKDIIGKSINICNENVTVEDDRRERITYKYKSFKILWLCHNPNLDKVTQFLKQLLNCNGLKIIKCYEEIYKDYDKSNDDDSGENDLKTGNVIITVSFNEKELVREISGMHTFDSKKIRILTFGDSKKCFMCKQEGHIKLNCPNAKLKCDTCGKLGHTVCTYSNRVVNDVENNRDLPSNLVDENFTHNDTSQINTLEDVQQSLINEGVINSNSFSKDKPRPKRNTTERSRDSSIVSPENNKKQAKEKIDNEVNASYEEQTEDLSSNDGEDTEEDSESVSIARNENVSMET